MDDKGKKDINGNNDGLRLHSNKVEKITFARKDSSCTFGNFTSQKYSRNNTGNLDGDMEEQPSTNNVEMDDTGFELKLDGGSPMLKGFVDPFDVSPESKQQLNTAKYKTFSSPSHSDKRAILDGTLNPNFLEADTSTLNAASEFRALKENQSKGAILDYQDAEESEFGITINAKKLDKEEIIYDNSEIDDSSIKLNLNPSPTRQYDQLQMQESNVATQVDGNIHEAANTFFREQRCRKLSGGSEGNGFCLMNEAAKEYSQYGLNHFTEEKMTQDILEETDRNVDTRGNISDAMYLSLDKNISSTLSREGSKNENTNLLSSSANGQPNSQIDTSPVMGSPTKHTSTTQVISESDNEDYQQQADIPHHHGLKETQLVDNFSQSLVIEDDEMNRSSNKYDYDDAKDEDDDETIKTGRKLLQTFKIIESQSQSQSQLQSSNKMFDQSQAVTQTRDILQGPPETQKISSQASDSSEHSQNKYVEEVQPNTEMARIDDAHLRSSLSNTKSIERKETSIDQVSSPIKIDPRTNNNENLDDDGINKTNNETEVPNTSAVSIEKIGLDMKVTYASEKVSDLTSTPLNVRCKDFGVRHLENRRPTMSEKLQNVLDECQISENGEYLSDGDVINNDSYLILKNKIHREFDIEDICGNSSVFIVDNNYRITGNLVGIGDKGGFLFRTKGAEVEIDNTKLFAPICFCVGDPVKYIYDRRSNYTVCGLIRAKTNEKNDDLVKTLDNFNRLLIRKNKRKGDVDGVHEEVEVSLSDIYLSTTMASHYGYKYFHDEVKFKKFIDYQVKRLSPNPNDTLLNLIQIDVNSKPGSFIDRVKKGPFSKCLFVITGLNRKSRPCSSGTGTSKNNTPRHQRDKDETAMLIDFIELNGGSVLQDSGFQSIIKFKCKGSYVRKVNGVHASPRKAKIATEMQEEMDSIRQKEYVGFMQFDATRDKGDYYHVKFTNCSMSMKEDIANYQFACVLSNKHVRTLKYIEALCLKWPILHIDFIKRAMRDEKILRNWRQEWTKYLLISGESALLNCAIGLDIFQFYDNFNNRYRLRDQLHLNQLFGGKKVLVIKESTEKFRSRLHGRRKRNAKRRRVDEEGDYHDVEGGDSDTESEDNSVVDETCKHPLEGGGLDGPPDMETLLWIFHSLGFHDAIVVKEQGRLRCAMEQISKEDYVYVKYGRDLDVYRSILGGEQVVNWEWLVQCIITHQVV